MARLLIKTDGFHSQVLELKLGTNRLGRSPGNDFSIDHPTISARHCEIVLGESGIFVTDCNSTNGTFLQDKPVKKAALGAGQYLRLGDVELLVENTDVQVAIPKFELPQPAPPVVLTDGSIMCPRHPDTAGTHQCTACLEILCGSCVHRLRRRGGKILLLCPLCSHECEPLGPKPKEKKSLFSFLQKTVKLPFIRQRLKIRK